MHTAITNMHHFIIYHPFMKFLFSLLLFLITALMPLSAQPEAFYPEELVVTASALNMREKPSKDAKKVTALKRGDIVEFIEADNNNEYVEIDSAWGAWLKVRFQNKSGYVFSPHVTSTYTLLYEGDFLETLPPMNWYGVYRRDSFADELRLIVVRLEEEMNEFAGEKIKTVKTNQKDLSKFIVGTVKPLKPGYVGPLGSYEVADFFNSNDLGPGAMLSIHPGNEVTDTTLKDFYTLAATGCAQLNESMMVTMTNYKLMLMDYTKEPPQMQDLTPWVKTLVPEMSASTTLIWYGDLDMDNKPDAIINDCPYEVGCRSSLFLSSKRKPGEFIRKVSERFFGGD